METIAKSEFLISRSKVRALVRPPSKLDDLRKFPGRLPPRQLGLRGVGVLGFNFSLDNLRRLRYQTLSICPLYIWVNNAKRGRNVDKQYRKAATAFARSITPGWLSPDYLSRSGGPRLRPSSSATSAIQSLGEELSGRDQRIQFVRMVP
jgi:hypothetical protein